MSDNVKATKKPRKKPKHSARELKQIKFAREYFASGFKNAPECFVKAGYSPKGADANACHALKKQVVKDEIARLMKKQEKRINIKADDILFELITLAKSDIRDLFDADGKMKHPQQWPVELSRAVSSIKIEEITKWNAEKREHEHQGYARQIKLWDKVKSLELLGKYLKMWTEVVNINGLDGVVQRMKNAEKRLNSADDKPDQ